MGKCGNKHVPADAEVDLIIFYRFSIIATEKKALSISMWSFLCAMYRTTQRSTPQTYLCNKPQNCILRCDVRKKKSKYISGDIEDQSKAKFCPRRIQTQFENPQSPKPFTSFKLHLNSHRLHLNSATTGICALALISQILIAKCDKTHYRSCKDVQDIYV